MATGSTQYTEDGHLGELAAGACVEEAQHIDMPLYQTINHARWAMSEADINQARAVSSRHAVTQHEHGKNGFVPVGSVKSKYPEVYPGQGRETLVVMVEADSDFEYVEDSLEPEEEPTVHVGESNRDLVEDSIERINHERSGPLPELKREVQEPENIDTEVSDFGYEVKTKADSSEHGFASYEVTEGGDLSWDEVVEGNNEGWAGLISRMEDEDYRWIGVELHANHEYAAAVTEALEAEGYNAGEYFPEKKAGSEGPGDVVSLQYSKDGTGEIELTKNSVAALQETDLEMEVDESTGRDHTVYAEIQ